MNLPIIDTEGVAPMAIDDAVDKAMPAPQPSASVPAGAAEFLTAGGAAGFSEVIVTNGVVTASASRGASPPRPTAPSDAQERAAPEHTDVDVERDAASDEDSERCLLLEVSHDELDVIVDGLADPLQPVVAVALSSTCKGLRTPLLAALEVLKAAAALCHKVKTSCAEMRDVERLDLRGKGPMSTTDDDFVTVLLTADDFATLGMLLPKWLPRLQRLALAGHHVGDVGIRALCADLGPGAASSLLCLDLEHNQFGPAGAEVLAAALRMGAMPKLEQLYLEYNPIGKQGVSALAAPLRKLPRLGHLHLSACFIGDEGVASLVANLGRDEFEKLESLYIHNNALTDAGCATLIAAVKSGAMPHMRDLAVYDNHAASDAACLAVEDAVVDRRCSAIVRDNNLPV